MSIAQFDIKSAKKGRHWIESSMEAYIKTFKTKHWGFFFVPHCVRIHPILLLQI